MLRYRYNNYIKSLKSENYNFKKQYYNNREVYEQVNLFYLNFLSKI